MDARPSFHGTDYNLCHFNESADIRFVVFYVGRIMIDVIWKGTERMFVPFMSRGCWSDQKIDHATHLH